MSREHDHLRGGRPARGFTLLELAVVLAIAGVLAGLALPSIVTLVRGYQSRELAVEVLVAFREARVAAQKENKPIRLRLSGSALVIEDPTYTDGTNAQSLVRAVDPSAWTAARTFPLGDVSWSAPTSTALTAGLVFCPTSRGTYRETTISGTRLCGLGDLTSQTLNVRYTVMGKSYDIELLAAVGNARFRAEP